MKKLLEFLLDGLIGKENYKLEESDENDFVDYLIKVEPETFGLVIGKNGKTIKSIRRLLRVRAALEKKGVQVNVAQKD